MKSFIAAAIAGLALVTMPAYAQNVHLKGGANSDPTFTDQGLVLNVTGALAGLSDADVSILLSAKGNPTATCTNPSGQHQPPGQNPASVTLTGSESIPASELKNGNTPFNVTTNPPQSPIPGAPGCPGSSWTETITDVSFTSATIFVTQEDNVVLTVSCTFSGSTQNGTVPSVQVTCSSVSS